MQIFEGKSVFGGIAMGKIRVYKKDAQQVKRVKVTDAEAEIARYMQARDTAMQQLQQLYEKALQEIGETNAAIFEVHQMMLEDDDYNESVENIIRTDWCACSAVEETVQNPVAMKWARFLEEWQI